MTPFQQAAAARGTRDVAGDTEDDDDIHINSHRTSLQQSIHDAASVEQERGRAHRALVASVNPNAVDEQEFQSFVHRWRNIHEENGADRGVQRAASMRVASGDGSAVDNDADGRGESWRSSMANRSLGARRTRSSGHLTPDSVRSSLRPGARLTLRQSILGTLRTVSSRVASSQQGELSTFTAMADDEDERDAAGYAGSSSAVRRSRIFGSTTNSPAVVEEGAMPRRRFRRRPQLAGHLEQNEFAADDEAEEGSGAYHSGQQGVANEHPIPSPGGSGIDGASLNDVPMSVLRVSQSSGPIVTEHTATGATPFADQLGSQTTVASGNAPLFTRRKSGDKARQSQQFFGGFRDPHKPPLGGRSFGIFSSDNPLRVWLARRLQSRWFEPLVLLLVLFNCILLLIDTRRMNEKEVFGDVWYDYALLALFILYTLEVLCKMIVFGVFRNPPPLERLVMVRRKDRGLSDTGRDRTRSRAANPTAGDDATRAVAASTHASGGGTSRSRKSRSRQDLRVQISKPDSASVITGDTNSHRAVTANSPFGTPIVSPFASPVHSEASDMSGHDTDADSDRDAKKAPNAAEINAPSRSYLRWLPSANRPVSTQPPPPPSTNRSATTTSSATRRLSAMLDRPLPHTAYLRHTFNRIDFIAVVAFWIDIALMLNDVKDLSLFKGLAAMRPVRLLVITSGLSTIMHSLKVAMPLLADVTGFISYFFLLFGIIALQAFRGSLSRRCTATDADGSLFATAPEKLCGSYRDEDGMRQSFAPGKVRPKGYICPVLQQCTDTRENPHSGYVSYDNIFTATLTIFTSVSTEGWTETMYWTMDAEYGLAALYYCFLIITMSFIIMQLFIAVVTESFGEVRNNSKSSAFQAAPGDALLLQQEEQDEALAARAAASRMQLEEAWMMAEEGRRPSIWQRIHTFVAAYVEHPAFAYVGGAMVASDLGITATRSWHSSDEQIATIHEANTAFTVFFAIEILVRVYASASGRVFWSRINNRVDLVLAIATTLLLLPFIHDASWYRYTTVLMMMRFYRVVPLIPRINVLASKIFSSFSSFLNVIFFMGMTLMVTSAVTMQVFSGEFSFDDPEAPSLNFDSFGDAYLALFVLLTGENWNELLYNCMRSQKGFMVIVAALFVVIFYCFSHYVIANLFVAVLLENFELDEEEKRARQITNFLAQRERHEHGNTQGLFGKLNPYLYMKPKPRLLQVSSLPKGMIAQVRKSLVRRMLTDDGITMNPQPEKEQKPPSRGYNLWTTVRQRFRTGSDDVAMEETDAEHRQDDKVVLTEAAADTRHIDPTAPSGADELGYPFDAQRRGSSTSLTIDGFGAAHRAQPSDDYTGLTEKASRAEKGSNNIKPAQLDGRAAQAAEFRESYPTYERSLFLFYPGSRIRRFCQRLAGNRESREAGKRNWFDWLIIIGIVGSVVVVVLDTPVHRRELHRIQREEKNVYPALDAIFLFVFGVELLVRSCAHGFLFTPDAYLRDPWNRMDFVVLLTMAGGYCMTLTAPSGLARTFRATRAIRPLRLISQFRGTREIFFSTISSVPNILYTAALSILFIIPFAVYGVTVFAGYFAQCNDGSVAGLSQCAGEYLQAPNDANVGILIPRTWRNPYQYSFDSFGSALLLLFEMASGEGWVDVLFTGMAVPPRVGMQSRYTDTDASWYNAIFFCIYMLFGSVVLVQLFIGVIVENLKTRSGMALLTVDQRRWIDLTRQLKMLRPTTLPVRPTRWLRGWCFDMATNKRSLLARFVTAVTCLNLLLMMTEHRGQPRWLESAKDYLATFFTIVYAVEVAIKWYGLGTRKWSKNRWNLFDMLVMLGAAITDICLLAGQRDDTVVQTQKFFMVAITFKLVQRIGALQMLFNTLATSIPSIMNIITVLLLVFIVYSILFMEIFALTRTGRYADQHANFRSFGNTLLLLLRMSTGENWHYLMHDMMIEPPYCIGASNYLNTDCGSRYWALFLFISFYIIGTYILLNMFIVVVIENFSYTYQRDIRASYVTPQDLRAFKRVWAEFDPRCTGFIPVDSLPGFLRALTGSFSMRIYDDAHDISNLRRRHVTRDATTADVSRMNRSLAAMDVEEVRRRRRRYNIVYQEAMLVQERRGIAFQAMLSVLAYSLVETERCLKVEDLIKRQQREEELLALTAREKVASILRTLIQRRRFRQLIKQALEQAAAEKSGIGTVSTMGTAQRANSMQLNVPSIVLQSGSHSGSVDGVRRRANSPIHSHRSVVSTHLSADEMDAASDSETGSIAVMPSPRQPSPKSGSPASEHLPVVAALHSADNAPDWQHLTTADINSENADSVLRAATDNVWYGIMEEERDQHQ